MSFLKNMLFGGTGISAANNAHLAELTLPKLSVEQKQKIIGNLLEVMRIGAPHLSDDDLHRMFRDATRIVQLNFLAFTMLHCDISPAIAGEQWQIVRNPFATAVDDIDLKTNAGHFRRKYGISVAIKDAPTNPIDEMDFSNGNADTKIENPVQIVHVSKELKKETSDKQIFTTPKEVDSQVSNSTKKKWSYDSKTKILKNNHTGMEYRSGQYEHQSDGATGYQIFHGPDVWVNDWGIEFK